MLEDRVFPLVVVLITVCVQEHGGRSNRGGVRSHLSSGLRFKSSPRFCGRRLPLQEVRSHPSSLLVGFRRPKFV